MAADLVILAEMEEMAGFLSHPLCLPRLREYLVEQKRDNLAKFYLEIEERRGNVVDERTKIVTSQSPVDLNALDLTHISSRPSI